MGCDCHHPSLTAGMCIRTKAYSGFLPQIVLTMCSAFICVLMSLFLHLCMRHLRAYSHHFSILGLKRNLSIINNTWLIGGITSSTAAFPPLSPSVSD